MKFHTIIIYILVLGIPFLFIHCGVIAPNIASVTITSDDDDTTDVYTGIDLKNVMVAYNTSTATNINKGTRKKFEVQWWGDYQYALPISYSVESRGEVIHITTSEIIKNFDTITIHLGVDADSWNKKRSPQIEYK